MEWNDPGIESRMIESAELSGLAGDGRPFSPAIKWLFIEPCEPSTIIATSEVIHGHLNTQTHVCCTAYTVCVCIYDTHIHIQEHLLTTKMKGDKYPEQDEKWSN